MKNKFLLIVSVCFSVMIAGFCGGCSRGALDSSILNDNAAALIDKDFYDSNRIKGAYDAEHSAFEEGDYPDSRTLLINTQAQYDAVFASTAGIDIDFQNEMIVVYSFVATNTREITIQKASVLEDAVKIELKVANAENGIKDTSMPYQRYVVIKISKTDRKEAVVVLLKS